MRRISFIATLLLCTLFTLKAQNEMQALRYSQYNPFGTARFAAQGGATGALGSDLSSILTNPAGLGFYRKSELSITPSFYWVNTTSNFHGSIMEDSQMKFNLGSVGFVSAHSFKKEKGIVSASFSLGYNTLVNFNKRTTVRTNNGATSLLDDFTWHANADPENLSPYYEQLAIDTELMLFDEEAGYYWHDMQVDGYGQQQHRLSQQSGYIGEYSLAGAFNLSNILYFGATAGIHAVRFYEDIYHTEADYDDHVMDFDNFQFREFNSTRGWGYTFRFGMILRPIQLLRVGASVQLPTFYQLTDEKFTDIKAIWDRGTGIPDAIANSPNGIYDYKLRTPFRASANASVILFRLATISAGYEYVDYSSARLDAYDYKFVDENDQIRQDLQVVHNLKAGAEIRIQSFYLRGGAQYLMNPFVDSRNNAESWIYSGGLGFRMEGIFFDMSYAHSNRSEVYGMYAYEPGTNEVSINEINSNNLMFTIGFKF